MLDAETGSLWSHILGQCMEGELKGERLEAIPCDMLTWKAWYREHPKTTVLNLPRTHKTYTKQFYQRPELFVVGIVENVHPYHCSFATLAKQPSLSVQVEDEPLQIVFDKQSTSARVFSRQLGDRTLTFTSAPNGKLQDQQTHSVWDPVSGIATAGPLQGEHLEQRVGIVSFRQAWMTFHPDSRQLSAETPDE